MSHPPTVREILCTPDDSSVIKEMRIYVKCGNDNISSANVVFESGAEYYYPALDNNTISQCLFADSIGSTFNKLVAQNDRVRYSKLS
jgi:hypothetical protein